LARRHQDRHHLARRLGFHLVHHLQRFDAADNLPFADGIADLHQRFCARAKAGIKGADDGRSDEFALRRVQIPCHRRGGQGHRRGERRHGHGSDRGRGRAAHHFHHAAQHQTHARIGSFDGDLRQIAAIHEGDEMTHLGHAELCRRSLAIIRRVQPGAVFFFWSCCHRSLSPTNPTKLCTAWSASAILCSV
jgi:hypothetical protein